MAEKSGKPGIPSSWDEEFDVVVVGYGFAGGISAIEAHDAGSRVLLIEKMLDPGGISICSGGSIRFSRDPEKSFAYLKATNAGTTPDDVLRALAEGMREIPDYIARLAEVNDARPVVRPTKGNYPFPGFETFEGISIDEIPGFDPASQYPHVSKYLRANGTRLFKVVEDNVARRRIPVRLSTPALRLLTNADGEVYGLVANPPSGPVAIKARRAVILACGGFEADEEMKRQYWQEKPVLSAAFKGNTGDGIRMAADVGAADLWHMWHYHGSYGLQASRPQPIPVRRPPQALCQIGCPPRRSPERRQDGLDNPRQNGETLYERIRTLCPGYRATAHAILRSNHTVLSAHSLPPHIR